MAAYVLFDNLEVRDPGLLLQYKARAAEVVRAYRGHYVVLGGPSEILEGNWAPAYPVMLEFPSDDLARAWYAAPEYQPLKAMRLRAVRSSAVLLEGSPTPDEDARANRERSR
jgi:uncharacterized protein (DUF1330 family)